MSAVTEHEHIALAELHVTYQHLIFGADLLIHQQLVGTFKKHTTFGVSISRWNGRLYRQSIIGRKRRLSLPLQTLTAKNYRRDKNT